VKGEADDGARIRVTEAERWMRYVIEVTEEYEDDEIVPGYEDPDGNPKTAAQIRIDLRGALATLAVERRFQVGTFARLSPDDTMQE
jgi:hypothetical protein